MVYQKPQVLQRNRLHFMRIHKNLIKKNYLYFKNKYKQISGNQKFNKK